MDLDFSYPFVSEEENQTNRVVLVLFSLKVCSAHASAFTLIQPGKVIIQDMDFHYTEGSIIHGFGLVCSSVKQKKND